ncbi:hypothetical protein HOLleu_32865 [Holothuria leucospilota]|uniref:Uncharacterized protein n=1 Tax=Holothuria leucospilota TaxID=206669 RepID=A0A9Q1BJC6_HOLLE|nr:hypothetical protein HOLleu_32865 [Holothuria leucospilota]
MFIRRTEFSKPCFFISIHQNCANTKVKEFITHSYRESLSQKFVLKHKKLIELNQRYGLPEIPVPKNRPVRQKDLVNTAGNFETGTLIFNLSSKPLTTSQSKALERGLSFCPSKTLDRVQLCSDYEQFARRIRLKEFFGEQSEGNTWSRPINYKPSTWTPPKGRNMYVDAFVEKTRQYLNSFLQDERHTRVEKNIDEAESKAIYDLKYNTSIVVKPADKGGATVILNRVIYQNSSGTIKGHSLLLYPPKRSSR